MNTIISRRHPVVQMYRELADRRSDDGRLLLDGTHLIREALASKVSLQHAAVTDVFGSTPAGQDLVGALGRMGTEIVLVPERVMDALSPVRTPSGIVAVARRPDVSFADLVVPEPALVLVAVDLQNPGNLGAIARAAEAGGATGLIVSGTSADPFGWKALRGSMGSLLRLPTLTEPSVNRAVQQLREQGLAIIAALPRNGRPPDTVDLAGPVALLVGGEGPGLTGSLVARADFTVSLPMKAPVESLNAAVAAALLVYEASRQRASRSNHTRPGTA